MKGADDYRRELDSVSKIVRTMLAEMEEGWVQHPGAAKRWALQRCLDEIKKARTQYEPQRREP